MLATRRLLLKLCNRSRILLSSSSCLLSSSCSTVVNNASSDKLVTIEDRGAVRLIGINRPTKRNCVNRETALLLRDAFDRFDHDPTARVAGLHGSGGNFCAGYDLEELSDVAGVDAEQAAAMMRDILQRGPMVGTSVISF